MLLIDEINQEFRDRVVLVVTDEAMVVIDESCQKDQTEPNRDSIIIDRLYQTYGKPIVNGVLRDMSGPDKMRLASEQYPQIRSRHVGTSSTQYRFENALTNVLRDILEDKMKNQFVAVVKDWRRRTSAPAPVTAVTVV